MALRQVLSDWDWGATGIWSVATRAERWRGLFSDDLIDALQKWNDRGEDLMGARAQ